MSKRDPTTSELLIIEPNFTGHRMNYVRMLIDGWQFGPSKTSLATASETPGSKEYRLRFPEIDSSPTVLDLGPLSRSTGVRYQIGLTRTILRAKRRKHYSTIVVPEADKVLPWLAVSPAPSLSGITLLVMRAPQIAGRNPRKSLADRIKKLAIRGCALRGARVLVLAPATPPRSSYLHHGFMAVPDPIDMTSTPASIAHYKDAMRLIPDRKWIGVFGNITRRKNVDVVLSALVAAGPSGFGLILAGNNPEHEQALYQKQLARFEHLGGEFRLDNRLLSDEELDAAISSVDVAAIAHSSDGPSGILGKAISSGTFVLASGSSDLRSDIERLGGGVWTPLDLASMATALTVAARLRADSACLADRKEFARVVLDL